LIDYNSVLRIERRKPRRVLFVEGGSVCENELFGFLARIVLGVCARDKTNSGDSRDDPT
jgi:hypothetical protein